MRKISFIFTIFLASLFVIAGQTAFSKDDAEIRQFDLKGRVEAVDQSNSDVTVAHGDIPGFMTAMTMPYKVKDKEALSKIRVGDQIKAVIAYNQRTKETWLQNIVVIQRNRGEK